MLFVRTLGRGEGSQRLQASDELLASDRFFRRLNFGGDALSQWEALTPRARAGLEAYCRGVILGFERFGIPWVSPQRQITPHHRHRPGLSSDQLGR